MDAVKIFFDLLGRTQGERDIERFARSIEDAGDQAGTSSKKFDGMSKDTDRLGARVEEARKKVKTLHEEFQRTGDTSVLGDLKKAQGSVNSLERLQKNVTNLGDAATKTGLAGMGMINPFTIAAAAAVTPFAAITVGATVSGLALAGLGGAVIALGAATVSGSARVQNAFNALKSTAGEVGVSAGRQLEGPITRALNILRDGAQGAGGSLTRMFTSVSPSIERLALGLRGMAQNAMPGLEKAVAAAGPVLDKLAQELPNLGANISSFFDSIAAAAPGAGRALVDLMQVIGVGLRAIGNTLEGLSKAYDFLAKSPIGKFSQDLWRSLMGVVTGHQRATAAAGEHAMKERDLAGEAIASANALRQTASQATQLANVFDRISGKTVNFKQAQIQVTQALDGMRESLKGNGASFDANTTKGAANTAQLLAVRAAVQSARQAILEQGGSERDATVATAGYIVKQHDLMRAAGLSEAQIKDLGFALDGLPPRKAIAILTPGAAKSITDVETLHYQEGLIHDKAITLDANTARGRAAILALKSLLNEVRSRTIELAVHTSLSGGAGSMNALDYSLAHRASGGPVTRGQSYIVGENGPEVFTAQSNGQILPNSGSGSGARAEAGGTTTNYITITTGADPESVVAAIQRYAQRNNGIPIRGGVRAI